MLTVSLSQKRKATRSPRTPMDCGEFKGTFQKPESPRIVAISFILHITLLGMKLACSLAHGEVIFVGHVAYDHFELRSKVSAGVGVIFT